MATPASAVAQEDRARPAADTASGLPVVLGLRVGEHADHTRLVLELSDPVRVGVFTLANPNRAILTLPEALWHPQNPDRPTGRGLVKAYRYGVFRGRESRLIIDLNGAASIRTPLILPPSGGTGYRVVLDLYPATQAQFEQASGWPADLREGGHAADLATLRGAESEPSKKVIVIDAGHGGIDAGTTGVNGSREKDLVLDEARRLARALQRRGYRVHLTRDTDVYVPLRQRVSIARSYDSDLFISLHADSNPDEAMAGASVYTLSERGSNREAAALALKENQSDIIAGVDLKGQDQTVSHILIDLAQRETINRSIRFAQTVVSQLGRATDVIARDPHRSAAFAVLKAPDVPAVLIELGYLSNGKDCSRMATASWRAGVASAIAAAVDRQFEPELARSSVAVR
ncbi:MAG: N-acetylmuramoyl-L-alanine amidase [Alphaproteobacteria bacterium]|nr:N-acetylmuramoyl-L-alanine amidase [Alphaproteobacteria bacterium]